MTATQVIETRATIGCLGFALGAAALLLVLVHFWAGPFAPQQKTTITVGEVAAEIRQAAIRKMKGIEQPKAQAAPWDRDRLLRAVAAILSGLAVIASIASLVRKEPWRPAAGGVALAAGAITFQLFTWMILVLAGAIVLSAIIYNIGDILGS